MARNTCLGGVVLSLAVMLSLSASAVVPTGIPDQDHDNIQAAIDAAPGGTVVLSPGTFVLKQELELSNGTSLVGGGSEPGDVVLSLETWELADGDHSAIVIAGSPNTVVSNLTLTAVKANVGDNRFGPQSAIQMDSGLVVDCLIREWKTRNNSYHGAGVNMTGGTVRRCTITKCDAQDSSGGYKFGDAVYAEGDCLIENCTFTENGGKDGGLAKGAAGGTVWIKGGILRSCLIANNRSRGSSSGVTVVGGSKASSATRTIVENCTIVGNRQSTADSAAHGLCVYYNSIWSNPSTKSYNVILRNNIIWGNLAYDGKTEVNCDFNALDVESSTIDCNDSRPLIPVPGVANISVDPQFADPANGDYHASGYTFCVDSGVYQDWMDTAVDLDGNSRLVGSKVDLGCYERASSGGLECRMNVESDGELGLANVKLTCEYMGGAADSATWTLTRQQDAYRMTLSGFEPTLDLPVGVWDVKVVVSGDAQSATSENTSAIVVKAASAYVNASGLDRFPYATPEDGCSSIDEAIALVGFGGTLYVCEGSYVISNPINLNSPGCCRIVSLAGPETTIIRLAECENFQSLKNYGVTLSHDESLFSGITVVAGLPGPHYEGPEYWSHGLVKVEAAGAVVTNCVFSDLQCSRKNSGSGNDGLGLYMTAGTVVDSTITRVYHYTTGGAIKNAGVVCLMGGLGDRLRVIDCWDVSKALPGTTAYSKYGDIVGVYGTAVLRNSLVTGCTSTHESPVGAGIYAGATLGKDQGGTILNCTIVSNKNLQTEFSYDKTFVRDGETVTETHYYSHVGGVVLHGGNLINSIVADNWSEYDGAWLNIGNTEADIAEGIVYSLDGNRPNDTSFATEENHNIALASSDGLFRRPLKGDFTLAGHSVAINAGLLQDWMETAVDLDGRARVIAKVPDLGCYEARGLGFAIRLR